VGCQCLEFHLNVLWKSRSKRGTYSMAICAYNCQVAQFGESVRCEFAERYDVMTFGKTCSRWAVFFFEVEIC
jgi:hypothetical protein